MYHYRECGLPNVWLENGYRIFKSPDGEAISIADVEGLHRLIGSRIVRKPRLSGSEFRFLRKELDLSQAMIGHLLGVSAQTVALWERHGRVPEPSARLVRVIYQEQIEGNKEVTELLRTIADADRADGERLEFKQRNHQWKIAA